MGTLPSHVLTTRAVGCCRCSQVDTGPLTDAFDLHPYDNLIPSEEYDRQIELARESVRTRKVRCLMHVHVGDLTGREARTHKHSHAHTHTHEHHAAALNQH